MNIGKKIKALRHERGLTQSALAGDRITRNMLSLIESGNALPSLDTVMYLAERLRVPAGYLLAGESDEFAFRRDSNILQIRRAYANREYSICRELCRAVTRNAPRDDEMTMLIAECSLGIAKENFFDGHLRTACEELDAACENAAQSVYRTDHIMAEAAVYARYMSKISPSLYVENTDGKAVPGLADSDRFCRYVAASEAVVNNGDFAEKYVFDGDYLCEHIHIKLLMQKGKFAPAKDEALKMLAKSEELCGAVMYDIFFELEQCCREIGDFKGAYEYSNAKVVMLERLLSEAL